MIKKVDALKKLAVALGFGSDVSDYKGETVVAVLKEMAVKMECTSDVDCIHVHDTTRLLNFIADNYGSEEKEPYDLIETKTLPHFKPLPRLGAADRMARMRRR